jgi:hypothetical protein
MNSGRHEVMAPDQLTAILSQRVLNWRATPNRFLTRDRGWMPRWKFQPTERLSDATRLLEAANPEAYSIVAAANGAFCARVSVGGVTVEAHARTKPLAICLAIAKVIGVEVSR